MHPGSWRNLTPRLLAAYSSSFHTSSRVLNLVSAQKLQHYYKMSHNRSGALHEQQNDMYFGTEILNRVSFLREDNDFIHSAVTHPSTRFVFFSNADPLVNRAAEEEKLIVLTNGNNQLVSGKALIRAGLAANPQWTKAVDAWSQDNRDHNPQMRDAGKPIFLFLGIEDESVGLNLLHLKSYEEENAGSHAEPDDERYLDHQGRYQGIPYFAVDLTHAPEVTALVRDHVASNVPVDMKNVFFSTSRKHYLGFTHKEASLYSHGKMFLDWMLRNRFCPGCGSKVVPIHAGGKLRCINDAVVAQETDAGQDEDADGARPTYECPVKNTRVSNVSFPRTDAVIITAITNVERTKVLLSLLKRYAETKMYACTAGFMEPSETVEVATKREIWEETGVVCSSINIQFTQPWPFPGNLMIGCLGVVEFNGVNEAIHLEHDRELADARWFDVDFVRHLIYEDGGDTSTNPEGILLPLPESIAYLLIRLVVDQGTAAKL